MFEYFEKHKSSSTGNMMCRLCREKKLAIMLYPEYGNLLNERFEMTGACKHAKIHLLEQYEPG